MINVLVFPCGSENAAEIFFALRDSVHVNLFGASSVDDHGRMLFEQYIGGLPKISASDFDAEFEQLLKKYQIDMIFATHDTVAEYLAQRVDHQNTFLVNGDPTACAIARKKSLTYALFADKEWCPRFCSTVEQVTSWPIIVKPDTGQGGQGVYLVDNITNAIARASEMLDPIFVEYLPGDEVTVDCFSDFERKLIHIGPRTRERVKAGISMRSRPIGADEKLKEIAETINSRVLLRGPWFFQLKKAEDGSWKLLEICTRIAGTMVAQRAMGINLPLMAVQDFMKRKQTVLPNAHITLLERRICSTAEFNYKFDNVYIDFDDTLVCSKTGRVNASIIAFVYHMRNNGKKVHLLTRHEYDIHETLAQARISASLFDSIFHLKANEPKSAVILAPAVFVDNHFPERLEVNRALGVPVFDVDTVSLIRWCPPDLPVTQ